MKILQISTLTMLILMTLSTCKKYPNGGFVNQTRKHLFGGNDVGDSKTWKLKLYEVNGIDSTNIIQNGTTVDFYDITFKLTDTKYKSFTANTIFQSYRGSSGTTFNITFYNIDITKEDSVQCKKIDNVLVCYRNIYVPEVVTKNREWQIEKLTATELIINKSISNTYRIILNKK
jgi:hypothetical protein